MAKETVIGDLVIALKVKTEALEKGLASAKSKIKDIENDNKSLVNSNKNTEASFIAMSVGAVAGLMKIGGVIKNSVNEYNSYTQAMASLQDVSDHTGQSMDKFSGIMDNFSVYLTKSDLATTIKNFSLMGMSAEETETMLESLTNSAIRNRNANYTVSEAVKIASEGYRQGLSTLSDSAGVTENLSAMQENYAKTIGKTASQLTEAEKNQAYLNRTMNAAAPFTGAMEDYLNSLAGKQGEYSQAMRETQVAYAEALEPTLKSMTGIGTGLLNILGDLIEKNNGLATGVTSFVIVLGTAVVGVGLAKKAFDLFKVSVIGANTALSASPIGWILGILSVGIGVFAGVTTAISEHEEAQTKLNESTERYNAIKEGTYGFAEKDIQKTEQEKVAIEEQIALLEEYARLENERFILKNKSNELYEKDPYQRNTKDEQKNVHEEFMKTINQMDEVSASYNKAINTNGKLGNSTNDLKHKLEVYNKELEEANAIKNISEAFEIDRIKKQQQEAAQLKINSSAMQGYLNTIKKGEKNTDEYKTALAELTKKYPEVANAEGILINQAQGFIDAEEIKASSAWKTAQDTIQGHINMMNIAKDNVEVQKQVAQQMGMTYDENFKPKLLTILALLQAIGGAKPEEVPNITPTSTYTPKSSSSGSYSNKRLDNYKKELEYKKTLDKLSIQDEINGYNYALKSLAKTTDEKNEIRTKIYELNKELAQKEKELLDQQTKDYERYIENQQSLRGAEYDVSERTKDYDRIISNHRSYLLQIMKDERLSLDERKSIYQEEVDVIRGYEQQKRDLRVEAIDNTVTQLTNAITKQLDEMQKADKEGIDKNLEAVEKWKNERIKAINDEYDARIEAINKELDALDKAEANKSRAEEDTEFEKKKKRLEELAQFEHDAVTKANYQKELNKLISDYQKTLDKRTLDDKKEALKEQQDVLKEEQNNKIDNIAKEAEKQKEVYDKQLEALDKYYEKQNEMAQETAEKMLLNTEQNQEKILQLLKDYGNAYEITGQTLGEKLAQGINKGLADKIENIIQRIQDTIDAGLEKKIKEWTSGNYMYEGGSNKPQTSKTVNVYQTNNIQQNPEMPSEAYRKLRNVSENLASELAGL